MLQTFKIYQHVWPAQGIMGVITSIGGVPLASARISAQPEDSWNRNTSVRETAASISPSGIHTPRETLCAGLIKYPGE